MPPLLPHETVLPCTQTNLSSVAKYGTDVPMDGSTSREHPAIDLFFWYDRKM